MLAVAMQCVSTPPELHNCGEYSAWDTRADATSLALYEPTGSNWVGCIDKAERECRWKRYPIYFKQDYVGAPIDSCQPSIAPLLTCATVQGSGTARTSQMLVAW
jgi:hypothetical protein